MVKSKLKAPTALSSLIKAFEFFSKGKSRKVESPPACEKVTSELQNKINQLDVLTHYLHSILGNISQGILFVDLEGIITTYNPAAENILEIDHLDLLFNHFSNFFEDDALGFSMKEALSKKVAPKASFAKFKTPQGKERFLEITTSFILNDPLPAPTSEQPMWMECIQGIIVLIRDLSEIQHLQLLASRQSRLQEIGEMVAMMAHEIRNPLGGIKGFASLLQRDLRDQPPLQQMANHIVEGTDSLNRIVNDVLHYSRPVNPAYENVDLIALIQDLKTSVFADDSISKNIDISIDISEPTLFVPIDTHLIRSALLNLLLNAIQAIEEKGKINIACHQEHGAAVLTITDTGKGIPEDDLKKIFSPFFTTKPDGNGLGLSEVHKVVQAHGGTIDVHSAVGVGSSFTIRLPLKAYMTL